MQAPTVEHDAAARYIASAKAAEATRINRAISLETCRRALDANSIRAALRNTVSLGAVEADLSAREFQRECLPSEEPRRIAIMGQVESYVSWAGEGEAPNA